MPNHINEPYQQWGLQKQQFGVTLTLEVVLIPTPPCIPPPQTQMTGGPKSPCRIFQSQGGHIPTQPSSVIFNSGYTIESQGEP